MNSPLTMRPALHVHVVWHPEYTDGAVFARRIFNLLARSTDDPFGRTPQIPVFFRSEPAHEGGEVPIDVSFEESQHSAVLIFVEKNMVASEAWNKWLVDHRDRSMAKQEGSHRIFAVAVTPMAFNSDISNLNFFRLFEVKPPQVPEEETPAEKDGPTAAELFLEAQGKFIEGRFLNELGRLLYGVPRINYKGNLASPRPVRLFLSHAKRDGVEITRAIRIYISENLSLRTFFDATDIGVSYEYSDELMDAISESSIICVLTDHYATREWTLWEVIHAKKRGRPLVVLNAIQKEEPRTFPYLGNVRTLRWNFEGENQDAQIDELIQATILEVVRQRFLELEQLRLLKLFPLPGEVTVIGHPPELFTLTNFSEKDIDFLLYPDPPLGTEELNLLEIGKPGIRMITPSQLPFLSIFNGDERDE